MSRWYFTARVGSCRRAWSAAMKRASRSSASPCFVGPPCLPERPDESREGTRPLKLRTAASEWNLLASPRRPWMTAPVTGRTLGAEVMIPTGSRSWTSTAIRSSSSLISSLSVSASRASTAMSSASSVKGRSSAQNSVVALAAVRILSASASPQAPQECR